MNSSFIDLSNNVISSFEELLRKEHQNIQKQEEKKINIKNAVKIDLHCHDHNSDKPTEQMARILNIPETWTPTETVINKLKTNGTNPTITITNHENSRSCWDLLEKGHDILVGAEFSCLHPEYQIIHHVLTYGFSPEQEKILDKLRYDIYDFLKYTKENDIPTILAHPLYFKSLNGKEPPLEMYDKLSLMFNRFECLNGNRTAWQNILTTHWVKGITLDKQKKYSKKYNIAIDQYIDTTKPIMLTGGSDDHMAINCGVTGTWIEVTKNNNIPMSQKILEGINNNRGVMYGPFNFKDSLVVALMDFFCQAFINMKDSGLIRTITHKGSIQKKLLSLAISNTITEIRRHNKSSNFFISLHEALIGKKVNFIKTLIAPKKAQKIIEDLNGIASYSSSNKKQDKENIITNYLANIQNQLLKGFLNSLTSNEEIKNKIAQFKDIDKMSIDKIVTGFELSSQWRDYFYNKEEQEKSKKNNKLFKKAGAKFLENKNIKNYSTNIDALLDKASFPLIISSVIQGTFFASNNALYKYRNFLNQFSNKIGTFEHPKRILWLTDTLDDSNGVSVGLKQMLNECEKRNLPIDFLVVNNKLKSSGHLKVINSLGEFSLPFYKSQKFNLPDLMQIQDLFAKNGYDRIICSTELFMGLVAVFLKHSFFVPIYFYMHTDWMEYGKKSLGFDKDERERFRRMLRWLYKQYDGIFVLNDDHKNWLASRKMGFKKENLFINKHWVSDKFKPLKSNKKKYGYDNNDIVLLYIGRISEEKGIFRLEKIVKEVKKNHVNVKMLVVGEGPQKDKLKKQLPDAKFFEWMSRDELPQLYSSVDFLLFPSKFDAFGRVVLEAISCGLPVIAYNKKGPKTILKDNQGGVLVNTKEEFSTAITHLLNNPDQYKKMKKSALKRSKEFDKTKIIKEILVNTKMMDKNKKLEKVFN